MIGKTNSVIGNAPSTINYFMGWETGPNNKAIVKLEEGGKLSLEIPSGLQNTFIAQAFSNVPIKKLKINAQTLNSMYTSAGIFSNCGIENLDWQPYAGQSFLGTNTFLNNNLESVTVRGFGGGTAAFKSNKLKNITLTSSFTSYGIDMFANNELEEVIVIQTLNAVNSGVFSENLINTVYWNTDKPIPANCFSGTVLKPNLISKFYINHELDVISIQGTSFNSSHSSFYCEVYVDASLITNYQTATNWSALYSAGKVEFIDKATLPIEIRQKMEIQP